MGSREEKEKILGATRRVTEIMGSAVKMRYFSCKNIRNCC